MHASVYVCVRMCMGVGVSACTHICIHMSMLYGTAHNCSLNGLTDHSEPWQ